MIGPHLVTRRVAEKVYLPLNVHRHVIRGKSGEIIPEFRGIDLNPGNERHHTVSDNGEAMFLLQPLQNAPHIDHSTIAEKGLLDILNRRGKKFLHPLAGLLLHQRIEQHRLVNSLLGRSVRKLDGCLLSVELGLDLLHRTVTSKVITLYEITPKIIHHQILVVGYCRSALLKEFLKFALTIRHAQVIKEATRIGSYQFRHMTEKVGTHRMQGKYHLEILRLNGFALWQMLGHVRCHDRRYDAPEVIRLHRPFLLLRSLKGRCTEIEHLIRRNLQRAKRVAVVGLLRTFRSCGEKRIQFHVRDRDKMKAALLCFCLGQFLKGLQVALGVFDIRREFVPHENDLADAIHFANLVNPVQDLLRARHKEDIVMLQDALGVLQQPFGVLAILLLAAVDKLLVSRNVRRQMHKLTLNLVTLAEEAFGLLLDSLGKPFKPTQRRHLEAALLAGFEDGAFDANQKLLGRIHTIRSRLINDQDILLTPFLKMLDQLFVD